MDNFFGDEAPPSASATEDGGFTFLEDAGTPTDAGAAFVGDVQEQSEMGFAAVPDAGNEMMYNNGSAPDAGNEMMYNEGAPDAGNEMMFAGGAPEPMGMDDNAPILLGSPDAVEDTPIVLLGAPPTTVESDEEVEPEPEREASAMKKFNEEWLELMETRRGEEDAAKAAMIEAARVAMEEFQNDASTKCDAKMAKNREDEQAKLEDIEADLENDNSWQRVSKMVDLTQDGAEDGEDTKRMRDIFILLKNEQGLAAKVGA